MGKEKNVWEDERMIAEAFRNFFESLRNLVKIPELRIKILYTFLFLFIYRIGSHIPIPGVDMETLDKIKGQFGEGAMGGILVLFSTISGGALGNCAIFSLGIMPYISASIIFSLLVKIVPSLEAIAKEGPSGYKKINEYTRYATVPLCILQAWMIVKLLVRPHGGTFLVPPEQTGFEFLAIVTLTAGAIFLMWLGEQINDYGVGNGISILIMAGIVSRMPHEIRLIIHQAQQGEGLQKFFMLLLLFIIIVAGVVYMTYGQRKITIQQAKHTRGRRVYGGQKHFLPLKVNQSGVMPVIFASSVLVFPITIFSLLGSDERLFEWGGFWYI
jgi:preprotein translocase subunit SecY